MSEGQKLLQQIRALYEFAIAVEQNEKDSLVRALPPEAPESDSGRSGGASVPDHQSVPPEAPEALVYVMDTNVFQIFIDPSHGGGDRAGRAPGGGLLGTFHNRDIWTLTEFSQSGAVQTSGGIEDGRAGYTETVQDVIAQSKMLSAELALHPSSGASVVASSGHMLELEVQLQQLDRDIRDRIDQRDSGSFKTSVWNHIKAIEHVESLSKSDVESLRKQISDDELFDKDLNLELIEGNSDQGTGTRGPELSRGELNALFDAYIAKRAAQVLARNDIVEPIWHASRIPSREIAGRLRTLESVIGSGGPAASDLEQLSREFDVLLRRQLGHETGRSNRAIAADARTLALVALANQNDPAGRRFAFVTYQEPLINAYRDWYLKQKSEPYYAVRHLSVFAPYLNFKKILGLAASDKGLFAAIRKTVEALLFKLDIWMNSALREPELIEAGTHHPYPKMSLDNPSTLLSRVALCQIIASATPEQLNELSKKLTAASQSQGQANHLSASHDQSHGVISGSGPQAPGEKTLAETLEELSAAIRKLERASVAGVGPLIAKRFEVTRQKIEERLKGFKLEFGSPDSTDEGIISELLIDKILAETARDMSMFAHPSTVAWLREVAGTAAGQVPAARFNVPLLLPLPGSEQEEFVEQSAWSWLRRAARPGLGPEPGPDPWIGFDLLLSEPDVLFALAAWAGFLKGQYPMAIRYAEMSSHPMWLGRSKEGTSSDRDNWTALPDEQRYLAAVASRIRMASTQPFKSAPRDVWLDHLRTAEVRLAESIGGPFPHKVLRAIAERATLRLTYCAWWAFGDLSQLSLPGRRTRQMVALFRDAASDLATADGMLRGLWLRPMPDSNLRGQLVTLEKEGRAGLDSNTLDSSSKWFNAEILSWVDLQVRLGLECVFQIADSLLAGPTATKLTLETDTERDLEINLQMIRSVVRELQPLDWRPRQALREEELPGVFRLMLQASRIRHGETLGRQGQQNLQDWRKKLPTAQLALDDAIINNVWMWIRHRTEKH